MTVRELLMELTKALCLPAVQGEDLVFDRDPPESLQGAIRVLQTGLRAVLTGRRWIGIDGKGRGAGRPDGTLEPGEPLPAAVRLLTVEGDAKWDRVPAAAFKALPRLFAAESRRAA